MGQLYKNYFTIVRHVSWLRQLTQVLLILCKHLSFRKKRVFKNWKLLRIFYFLLSSVYSLLTFFRYKIRGQILRQWGI